MDMVLQGDKNAVTVFLIKLSFYNRNSVSCI